MRAGRGVAHVLCNLPDHHPRRVTSNAADHHSLDWGAGHDRVGFALWATATRSSFIPSGSPALARKSRCSACPVAIVEAVSDSWLPLRPYGPNPDPASPGGILVTPVFCAPP